MTAETQRISLPAIMVDGMQLTIELQEDGHWLVRWSYGDLEPATMNRAEDDTGPSTEWVVAPVWTKGFGMSVELLPRQICTISYASEQSLHVTVQQQPAGDTVLDATYTDVYLIVRELSVPPRHVVALAKADMTRGQRIRLVSTDDPWTELRPGDEGTVTHVDDGGTVHVCWDKGSHLGMIVEDNPIFGRKPGEVLDLVTEIPGPAKFCARCSMVLV